MRGRSLVGPFVLILLGAAFLINNVRPDLNLFTFLAKYWPFLLIGMGTLRLLEILTYAAAAKPLPRQGLSGGEIFLAIVIVVIGSGMFEARRLHPGVRFPFRRPAMDVFGEAFDYP